MLKTFPISLDINSNSVRKTNISTVLGDMNAYRFSLIMYNGSNVQDLTNITKAYLIFSKPDGTVVQATGTISGTPTDGTITYTLESNTISSAGVVDCEVQLFQGTDLLTSARFEFVVREPLLTDAAVESSNQFNALTQVIEDSITARDAANTAVTNANTALESAGQALADATQALDDANTAKTTADTAVANANEATANSIIATNNAIQATTDATQATDDTLAAILAANQAALDIAAAESDRATAESLRVESEINRVSAETDRTESETVRISQEDARVTAESARVSAETSRVNAETNRSSHEDSRVSAESARDTAESERVTAESARSSAESSRAVVESDRVTAESTRVTQENARKTAETARATAETSRVSAESARVTAENTRQTNTTNAINTLNTAVSTTQVIPKPEVANMAALNALVPSVGWLVHVLNIGDGTAAYYRYDGATWVKSSTFSNDTLEAINNKLIVMSETTQSSTAKVFSLPSTVQAKSNASVEVDGNSENNIITHGNFDALTNWSALSSTHSITNNVLTNTANGVDSYGAENQVTILPITNGKKIYVKGRVRVTNANATSLVVRIIGSATAGTIQYVLNQASPTANTWYYFSTVITIPVDATGYVKLQFMHNYADAATANGKVMEIDGAYGILAIDMGVDTSNKLFNLTADQMNARFPNWFDSTKSVSPQEIASHGINLVDKRRFSDGYYISASTGAKIAGATLFCTDYEPVKSGATLAYYAGEGSATTGLAFFDVNRVYISGVTSSQSGVPITIPANALYFRASFYKSYWSFDTAMINYGNSVASYQPFYEYPWYVNPGFDLKRVGTAYDKQFSDGRVERNINNPPKVLAASDVLTGSDGTGVTWVKINKFSDMLGFNAYNAGTMTLEGYTEKTDSNYDVGVGTFQTNRSPSAIYIGMTLGTTLTQAQTALTGKILQYTLATPVTSTQSKAVFEVDPNSTFTVLPRIKERKHYLNGLVINNSAYPVKTLISLKLVTFDGGVEKLSPVDTSTATIAADGLSFTITGATNDSEYEYVYEYDSALSVVPTCVVTYSTNIAGEFDLLNKSLSVLSQEMADNNRTTYQLADELLKAKTIPLSATASVISIPSTAESGSVDKVEGVTRNNPVKSSPMDTDTDGNGVVNDFSTVKSAEVTGTFTLDGTKKAQKIDITNSTAAGTCAVRQGIGTAVAGDVFSASVDYDVTITSACAARISIRWINSGGSTISYTDSTTVSVTGKGTLKVENATAPTNTASYDLYIYFNPTAASAVGTAWFKNAMLEKAPSVGTYISSGVKSSLQYGGRLRATGKNQLKLATGSLIANGVTATIDNDGYITLNGTTTLAGSLRLTGALAFNETASLLARKDIPLSSGTYKLSFSDKSGTVSSDVAFSVLDAVTFNVLGGDTLLNSETSATLAITSDAIGFLRMYAANGITFTNYKFRLMLEKNTVVTAFEPYSDTTAYISPTTNGLASLPNGVKDSVDLKGNWVQNVSNPYTIKAIDVSQLQTLTNIDFIRINKNALVGGIGLGKSTSQWANILGWVEKTSAIADATSDIGKYSTAGSSDQIDFAFTKGTFASLQAAKDWFTANSTVVYYQLATPILTKIEGMGQLQLKSSGALIFEPAVNFKARPVNGVITIPSGWANIVSIESVKKLTPGTDGSLAEDSVTPTSNTTTTITVAANTSLDTYEFSVTYFYDLSSTTIPTLYYTYGTNLRSEIDSMETRLTDLSKQVMDLNDFTVAMLLNHEARLTAHSI